MTAPRVSVLMTAYQAADHIDEAIASILGQSFPDLELVVVDDGSTDGTADRLAAHDDPRLVVIRQPNRGTAAAANAGLARCRGRFVARMDADDRSVRDRVERQVGFLDDHPDIGMVGGWTRNLSAGGALGAVNRLPADHGAIIQALRAGHHAMSHPTLMIRTEALRQIGGYWSFRLIDDWDMMLRMGEHTRLANLETVLLDYRVHGGSLNGQSARRMQAHIDFAIARADAREQGRPEPSYGEFLEGRLLDPLQIELGRRARSASLDLYRRSVVGRLEGRRASGLAALVAAGALQPGAVIRRMRR